MNASPVEMQPVSIAPPPRLEWFEALLQPALMRGSNADTDPHLAAEVGPFDHLVSVICCAFTGTMF